jgi:hypothetical protein
MPEADDPVCVSSAQIWSKLSITLGPMQLQLVLLLRYAGCPLCREALTDLSKQRAAIEASACGIVLVHMGGMGSAELRRPC